MSPATKTNPTDWLTKNLRDVFLIVILGIQGFIVMSMIGVRESQVRLTAQVQATLEKISLLDAAMINITATRYTIEHANKDQEINELKRELLSRDIEEMKRKLK